MNFLEYSRYYDLLYREKDYGSEARFVLECLAREGCRPRNILDLGCGTGRHDLEFAKLGADVVGVDLSEDMLRSGMERLSGMPVGVNKPELRPGDARSVRVGRRFDAVVSLFHVMSYQLSESDALAVLRTAHEHLYDGGLFFFDFWHGPGVLTSPPEMRERIMEDELTRVQRLATPDHRVSENRVDVHYSIKLTKKEDGSQSELKECHPMRYWFLPELRHLSRTAGFTDVVAGEWMNTAAPGLQSWNAWMVLRK